VLCRRRDGAQRERLEVDPVRGRRASWRQRWRQPGSTSPVAA